jgi:hypothetical protein
MWDYCFCKKAKFIKVIHSLDIQRTLSLSAEADVEQIQMNLLAFEKVARYQRRGPIALMDIPSRFRWLTALRSSVIQTSRPHPGLCDDLEKQAKDCLKSSLCKQTILNRENKLVFR